MNLLQRISRAPRGFRYFIGICLILLGIAGLFLPILQGLLLLALGLYVLGMRSRWLEQHLARWKAQRKTRKRRTESISEEPQPRT